MFCHKHPSNINGRLSVPAMALFFALIFSSLATRSMLFAQNGQPSRGGSASDRTRGFIDDYSNSFDSEFGSEFNSARESANGQVENQPDVDIKVLRPLIRNFSDGMTQLTYALSEQVNAVPGLRQSYSQALRLSGIALGLHKYADKHALDRPLQDQLRQLDADWRELAYRLENLRGVPEESLDLIKEMNSADQRIRQALGIQPQLDRRQLLLKSAGLVADLENLQEDMASELGNAQSAQVYRRAVGRIRQVILNLIAVIRDDRSDAKVIVEEYQQFETLWTPLALKLREEEDRYIERGLRRVSATSSEIHQLLLLPKKVDSSRIIQAAADLKRDIDEFFERTPLILVMQLPKAKQAIATADQFYYACSQFTEVVNQRHEQSEILESFRQIESAERAFLDVYRDLDSDKAMGVLSRISQTVKALRSTLHLQHDDFNRQGGEDLAASILNFTEQIEISVKRWIEQDRQPFAANCLKDAADLTDLAAQLHDDIANSKPDAELKLQMNDVYETWRRLYGYLVKCQTEDRATLGRISANLTPALVELRSMLSQ